MKTSEKLKQIISYWSNFKIPDLIERNFDESLIESDKILTISGPRRAGKTYLCYQIIKKLRGYVPEDNLLYINFEDERLYPLNGDELSKLLEIYYEIMDPSEGRIYLFLDEIQSVPNWERWCRRIDEREKDIKLILTGSSSKVMPSELSTSLRGRSLNRVVFPFSFKEFLKTKDITFDGERDYYNARKKSSLKNAFNEYLFHGGFPEVVLEDNEERKEEILREYYSTIFYKDIIESFNIDKIQVLEDFIKMRMDNFGCLMSFTQSRNNLKSMGHNVGKTTLSNYFSYAKKVFFLFDLEKYSYSRKKRKRNPRKVYPIDTGLVNAIRFNFSKELGRALETVVFLEMKRRNKKLFYSNSDAECDFLVQVKDELKEAFQVTWTLEGTQEREIEGLKKAMDKYDIDKGFILTEDEKDLIELNGTEIEVLPVWLWLLR